MGQLNVTLLAALIAASWGIWNLGTENEQLRIDRAKLESRLETLTLQLSND